MTECEEVWLRAWCSVADQAQVKDPKICTYWADLCLEEFCKRFRTMPDGTRILTPVRDDGETK